MSCENCKRLEADVTRLKDRLEEGYGFTAEGQRVAVPNIPDGITSRDLTIKGLDERVQELRAELQAEQEGRERDSIYRAQQYRLILAEKERLEAVLTTYIPVAEHTRIVAETIKSLDTERTCFEAQLATMTKERDEAEERATLYEVYVSEKTDSIQFYQQQLTASEARVQALEAARKVIP